MISSLAAQSRPVSTFLVTKQLVNLEGENEMKGRQKITLLSLACAVAFVLAGLAGLSPLTNTTKALAAAPEPVQSSCTAVNVTNIQSQSIALGAGEKITVDWSFNAPGGDGGCAKVQNFEVWIEVTRR